jgi:hypothetical protein
LLNAILDRSPCMDGWPSQHLFSYDYQLVHLSDPEFQFMQACDANAQRSVQALLAEVPLTLAQVRALQAQQLILLSQP